MPNEAQSLGAEQFSVVIPTRNRSAKVVRAVTSVLGQSFAEFEVIVVDDGSTDQTEAALNRLQDPRIHYVHQVRAGAAAARNMGATIARAPFLTFLDSDDLVSRDWLATFYRSMLKNRVAVACCGGVDVDAESGQELRVRLPRYLGPAFSNARGLFLAGSFCLRREVFRTIGGYTAAMPAGHHTDFAIRLTQYCAAKQLRIAAINRPMFYYNRGAADGIRQDHRAVIEAARYLLVAHHDRLILDRTLYASYCASAGVRAVRIHAISDAREFLLKAVKVSPLSLKGWLRLLGAMAPSSVRKCIWPDV